LIQNTGLLESGDALRGTLTRMRLPVVSLVSYRGYKSLPETMPSPLSADDLSRREVDSVAMLLEPTLRAWNLPYEIISDNSELGKILAAYTQAQAEMRPTAVVIGETMR
jgi:sulfopyruvate decarboxylase TPP-binding subunit